MIPDIEKIYLHTDKSIYFIGEDLWYKAYDVRASNNLLFDNSNILYVELISPDSKIIAQNKTNLEIGLGHGDFQLTDSLGVKPGVYQLRAYTNWNRNFGEDFVFKKKIEIIDVFESRSKTNKVQNSATETKIVEVGSLNKVMVDFFPEGGSLLENVASIVGFKSVDGNGNPINIKGEIYDSDNQLVTSFLSPHDGMGKFQMIPIEGKNYYAKIKTLPGTELRVELPKAAKQGYLLSFRTFKGKNIISINTNQATLAQNPNAALTVVYKAKGITYLESTQTLAETTLSFELAKDKTPDGISQITLYDNYNKPQSERLVYIDKEHDLEVQLSTDKASYNPNEKATVSVSSKSKAGATKLASFSLSVTDMNGVLEENDFGTNISSYFLMESDIRGKVHNPGYYFDATNLKRLEHLDDLLLTQGWRDFLWKTVPKSDGTINYIAEKGFTIKGKVKQLLGKKAKVNNNMSLSLMGKKGMQFFNTATDSIGKFKFENLIFFDTTQLFLSTKDEKGKFSGEIVLDTIDRIPPTVDYKKDYVGFSEITKNILDNVLKKYTAYGIKPENRLKEVKIIGTKKKQPTVLYGIPDFNYKMDKEGLKFSSASDLIMDKFQMFDFNKLISPESFSTIEGLPVILIDGNPINELVQLNFVSPEEIEKIEALRGTEMLKTLYGPDAGFGVISVFTNGKSTGNQPKKDIYQSIKMKIDGYYLGRTFYAPTPEQAELDTIAAVRNTVYWNPEMRPDNTGSASVSYHNTKVETKVKVALEGITGNGIPVTKTVYYTIKK